METCPVVRIKADNEDGFTEINASDYDDTKHELFDGETAIATGRVEDIAKRMAALYVEAKKLPEHEQVELSKRLEQIMEEAAVQSASNMSFDFGNEPRAFDAPTDGRSAFQEPQLPPQAASDGFAAPPPAAPDTVAASQEPAAAPQEPAPGGFAEPAATPAAPKGRKGS